MTQGRKSRTALAICCVLAVFAVGALAPAYAGAQAADNEYDLSLPGGGHSGGGGGQSQGTVAPASSDSGGGAPTVLIVLAAAAAVGTGIAVWRLRDRPGGRSGGVGHGPPEAAGETQ
jgi:hypothetical protein